MAYFRLGDCQAVYVSKPLQPDHLGCQTTAESFHVGVLERALPLSIAAAPGSSQSLLSWLIGSGSRLNLLRPASDRWPLPWAPSLCGFVTEGASKLCTCFVRMHMKGTEGHTRSPCNLLFGPSFVFRPALGADKLSVWDPKSSFQP